MSRYSMRVLLAFDAAGRHLSFSKAAEELNVSQSAISRNIATLEADLNCRLMARTTRSCKLTSVGQRLHSGIAEGLERIQSAISQTESEVGKGKLNISISPFLSVAWFTPRLLDFIEQNPDIDVNLFHSYDPPDFESDTIDIGINWGRRISGNRMIHSEMALRGDLIPVCTEKYAENKLDLKEVASLLTCQLFYEFEESDWQKWLEANGQYNSNLITQQISDTGALRQAALSGKGVALLFRSLIEEDVKTGKLMCPFDTSVDTGCDYWINYPVQYAERLVIRRFLQWFRRQISKS